MRRENDPVKMMILAPRRAGLGHAEFRRYVTEVHGPLVKSIPEVAAAIRHYHYNFPVPDGIDAAFGHPLASQLDIVTQGWFGSREAQLKNMAEPRYLSIIRPDESRFADTGRALMHYTREAVITEGLPTLSKVFYFRRRHPSLTREAFQARWLARFPQALQGHLTLASGVVRYVQNQVLSEAEHPNGTHTKFFDVIDEFFVGAPQQLSAIAQDRDTLQRVQQVECELLDTSRTRAFISQTVYNIP